MIFVQTSEDFLRNMDDDPNYTYCQWCKRNVDPEMSKKHKYTKTHKENVERILSREKKVFASFLSQQNDSEFYCFFCQVSPSRKHNCQPSLYVPPHKEFIVFRKETLEHIAGNSHARRLNKLWCETGKDPAMKKAFMISKAQLEKVPSRGIFFLLLFSA